MAQIDRPLLASELFAYAHEARCEGPFACHWCSAPCSRTHIHDDYPLPIIAPGYRLRSLARRPSSPFICRGCWLWRRKRVTITYLNGDFKDGQAASKQSWLILPSKGAFALNESCREEVWPFLLKPAKRFCLAFYDGEENHLQLMQAVDLIGVTIETPLRYTINNIIHEYTVYDLEQSIKHQEEKTPGVRGLVRMLGKLPDAQPVEVKKGRPKGKPAELDGRQLQRVVRISG